MLFLVFLVLFWALRLYFKMNYSALYELNKDIKNYRIKAPEDEELSALLSQASLALK